uniref:Uncharacterized protein n=1 Tax=Oryza nivara TaxID=4536 RepID=A0A0E0IT26_ORYNI
MWRWRRRRRPLPCAVELQLHVRPRGLHLDHLQRALQLRHIAQPSPYSFAFLLLSPTCSPPSISVITACATSPRVTAMPSSPNSSTGVVTPTASRSFRNRSIGTPTLTAAAAARPANFL